MISHEFTWLVNNSARAENPNDTRSKPVSEIIASVNKVYPTADVSAVMIYELYLTHAVMFNDTGHLFAIAYVNQYTGEIQEMNDGTTFIGFLRSLHD